MMTTSFSTARKVICQSDALRDQLGIVSKSLGSKIAMLVTDKGIVACGFAAIASESLRLAGVETVLFDGVLADPPCSVVREAILLGKARQVDLVIGLGGGSSIDTAKVVAVGISSEHTFDELLENPELIDSRVSLIAVPTTAGTGSEVTNVSVLSTDAGSKKAVFTDLLLPDVALLDATLTVGMPKHVSAATALDAMVHAIESYTSRTKKNPISDCLALKALELLCNNYPVVLEDGANVEAREAMLLGSTLAGMAFSNASVAAIHGLSYPLSNKYHIPHGHSNALVMIPVLTFNAQHTPSLYAELAASTFKGVEFGSDQVAADYFVSRLKQLFELSGLPMRLSELGVLTEDLKPFAGEVIATYTRLINTNPCDISELEVYRMYESIF